MTGTEEDPFPRMNLKAVWRHLWRRPDFLGVETRIHVLPEHVNILQYPFGEDQDPLPISLNKGAIILGFLGA